MKIKGSIVIAVVLALGAGGWILSGQFQETSATASNNPATPKETPNDAPKSEMRSVRVVTTTAKPHVAQVTVTGQTQASRNIELRAQMEGQIIKLGAKKGDTVQGGQVLIRFNSEDLPARLDEGKARVEQRALEFQASSQLAKKGYKAKTHRAESFANLQAAKAYLRRVQTDIEHTIIRAPFNAVLETRPVELGDMLRIGDRVARLIDLDPILVTAQVSERDYLNLKKGSVAKGRLLNGAELTGRIRYVSAAADPVTRTFKVELEIPNPGNRIAEGVTAELELPLPAIQAHTLPASAFTLDGAGKLGVRVLDAEDRVAFAPVAIVGGTADEAIVAGLPATIRVIVVGQEFVSIGETVRAVEIELATRQGTGS